MLHIVDVNWVLRRDAAGAPVEVVETAHRAETIHTADESSAALMTAYQALEKSEKKYRDLFNFMPIALWQADSRGVRKMFDDLRAAGVEDLAKYMEDHPEFLEEAQASVKITEANEQTLLLFGATDREELLEKLPSLWLLRVEDWVLARNARESGAGYYRAETTIQRMDGTTGEILFTASFSNLDEPETLTTVGAIDITEEKRGKERLENLLFPCDSAGHVEMDEMSERARDNYLFARAVVGCDYRVPVVVAASEAH